MQLSSFSLADIFLRSLRKRVKTSKTPFFSHLLFYLAVQKILHAQKNRKRRGLGSAEFFIFTRLGVVNPLVLSLISPTDGTVTTIRFFRAEPESAKFSVFPGETVR